MNNAQLTELLSRHPRTRRVFRGVFPRDLLPLRVPQATRCAYVINTDTSHGPGKHWVAVFFDGLGGADYFDSFGLPPRHVEVEKFIKRNSSSPLRYSSRLIQSVTSWFCGLYVVYFVAARCRGLSLRSLLVPFKPLRTRLNDRLVLRLLQQIYRQSWTTTH